jgi:hypothetical protein
MIERCSALRWAANTFGPEVRWGVEDTRAMTARLEADLMGAGTMADIDYGLAYDFLDADGRPRQLRFRRNCAATGAPDTFDGTGQLVAVIANAGRPDNGDEVLLSRPGVALTDIERALDGWQDWAMLTEDTVNLVEIGRRIQAAGLG